MGKSSIVSRFAKEDFDEYQDPTIGAAFVTQSLPLDPSVGTVRFEIWDTAGSERYRALAPMYYRGAAAAIVVYDITSKDSFENSKQWIAELKSYRTENETVIALAGNKCDLEENRTVTIEEAAGYAENQNIIFLETSAKSGVNVTELFRHIGMQLPKRETDADGAIGGFHLDSDKKKEEESGVNDASDASGFWSCCRNL